jgi:hypothetical protein
MDLAEYFLADRRFLLYITGEDQKIILYNDSGALNDETD